jgi:uridine kinase
VAPNRAAIQPGVGGVRVQWSASTWQQPMPPAPSAERAAVLDRIATSILAAGPRRLRVGVDGRTAAGKTSMAHELAERVADAGRPVLRASLDDFKRPWKEAHRYDRTSGEGYYRNAFDFGAARRLLLDPAAPEGDGRVALCSIDPITQVDHSSEVVELPADGVLVVDGVFAFRPELDDRWDLRIWVHIDAELSVQRGIARDTDMEGSAAQAEALHRHRYLAAETVYLAEVDPLALAQVVVDNTDFAHPRMLRGAG